MRARWDDKNKRWEASLGSGKRRRWFRSKVEGEIGRKSVEGRLDVAVKGKAPLRAGSLAEFIEDVWFPGVKVSATFRTRQSYVSVCDVHLAELQEMPIEDLRLSVLQKWVGGLSEGRSPKTVRSIFGVLRSILAVAHKSGRLSHRDYELVRLPRLEQKERTALTPKEVASLCEAAKGTVMEGPVWAASHLGLRRGEICGLKRPHIEVKDDCAIVTVVSNRQAYGEADRLKSRSKGQSKRLCLPKGWGERLLGFAPEGSLYIFCTRSGEPVSPNRMPKEMPALCKKAEVPQCTFHDLRHACATNLRESGAPEGLIQHVLGHSRPEMTRAYQRTRDEEMMGAFGRLSST